MRLDKYLKVSRLIKRRTVAQEAADAARITVNNKIAKPSTAVKEGDVIGIRFGDKTISVRVTSVREVANKEQAQEMYEAVTDND